MQVGRPVITDSAGTSAIKQQTSVRRRAEPKGTRRHLVTPAPQHRYAAAAAADVSEGGSSCRMPSDTGRPRSSHHESLGRWRQAGARAAAAVWTSDAGTGEPRNRYISAIQLLLLLLLLLLLSLTHAAQAKG